ncbi:cytochrome c biogenesis CcdA family protein [Roseovarius sp. ZX-A-9]|uniref:cytochrome c biogenesis CcdA family protein n=1 Tax=Roseovarius sp. ZX-A-9 TaxID=3014783 RepID=UPI00232E28F2|nr:cytochrome c biogenesis protein CcdA [Roseovarius sp. ZX-A-9]
MLDVSFFGAILGGLIVFFSPCVLPIVPFYLSYMAGASMSEISEDGALAPGVQRRAFLASIMFSLGIITVFVLMGAAAWGLSQAFRGVQTEFRLVAALIVFIMGLHFLGVLHISFLNRVFQLDAGETKGMSVLGAYVVGFAFAAGWTPCVGGVLTAVIFTASTESTALEGLWLLLVFGAAMTAPFVIASLFIAPFLRFAARFRKHLPLVEKAMGLLLIVFAVLIATDSVNYIAQWMLETFPAFQSI